MDNFEREYKKLNPEQKKAVDEVEGPVMVIAGPGTGKTKVLTLRIANILKKTQAEPRVILALTFTENGAVTMRRRLAEIIGGAAYEVNFSTYHGFCNGIIQRYPDKFPAIIGSTNITEVEQIELLEKILNGAPQSELKPFGDPLHHIKSIKGVIRDLKREGVSPEEFEKAVKEEEKEFRAREDLYHEKGKYKGMMKGEHQKTESRIKRNKLLIPIYKEHEKALREGKRYDYEDMIVSVLDVLREDKEFLLLLQEQYQYFLVDEHQDTNNAQNKILELLAGYFDRPNLFVVGDEKQAIYRFQGASIENFLYFRNLYKDVKLINLNSNYRSTQTILDAAIGLMAGRDNISGLKAETGNKEKPVMIYGFSLPAVEYYFIARDIKQKIKEGADPGEIAVFCRTNRETSPISRTFEKLGVPFINESEYSVLDDVDGKAFISILRAVNNFGESEYLISLLHLDIFGIKPLDAYKIIAYAGGKNLYEIIKSEEKLKSAGVEDEEVPMELYKKLENWNIKANNENLINVCELILSESGLLRRALKKPNAVDAVGRLGRICDEAESLIISRKNCVFGDFVSYLDTLDKHELTFKCRDSEFVPEGRVRLMTAHGAKGLEFDYVYITGANDKRWGNRWRAESFKLPPRLLTLSNKPAEQKDEDDDERNLFFVALTRARKEAVIVYYLGTQDGREAMESKFVAELKKELVKRGDTETIEKEFIGKSGELLAPAPDKKPDLEDKKFLAGLFAERGFSVTHLNNYLKCPWRYFYVNLLRIPQKRDDALIFGSVIHRALQIFFNKAAALKKVPPLTLLLKALEGSFINMPFNEKEAKGWLKRGQEAISGWYKANSGKWRTDILSELYISEVWLSPEIRLTGKLDKVELLGGGWVNVVDYKTGRPKSRGEIEGRTYKSDGGYKRQLVFYKLLLDKYQNGKYKMKTGEIDFVEPNDSGKYKKEAFEITGGETEELERLVKEKAGEIINGEFWDKTCSDPKCEWCELHRKIS
ncbi:MAG: DNA helicase II / ATP-dependent DNA helicase PcrA [Parcubacteria group bacterium Licking1014_17]|nr:MAG: DNA helicase II / ATP-dependent DNA helicase PcrA [Parcubacteria group bacterium Licking1014_17]